MRRTLASVQAQDHPDLEIVVTDDGSTDETPARLAAISDERLTVVRSEVSTGVAAARNRGLAAATGQWVAFVDDDDLWHSAKLTHQIDELQRSGRDWSYCGAVKVDDDLTVLGIEEPEPSETLGPMAFGNRVPGGCSTVVARRDLLVDLGGFNSDLSMFADWDLWIRLAGHGLAAPWLSLGVLYVQHGTQMSMDLSAVDRELARFRALHADLRRRQPQPPSVEGVDVWVGDRLRQARGPVAATAHIARNLHRADRHAVRMLVRALVGHRNVHASGLFARWETEVTELLADARRSGLPSV
jgi:Glycosyl transferase family 2